MAKKKPKATGDCATCPFWKMRGSKIKGKLVPGGTGKCTRPEGLCDDPKPKDPHPGWEGNPQEKGDVTHTPPETPSQPPTNGSHEVNLSLELIRK